MLDISEYEQLPTSKYEKPQQTSKKISWSESETSTMPSIFSKLKQTQTPSLEAQIETLTSRIAALESKLEQLTL